MCWADLAAVRQGWETQEDRAWERTLLMVNAWTGAGLTLDKIKGTRQDVNPSEKFREIIERVNRRKGVSDGADG